MTSALGDLLVGQPPRHERAGPRPRAASEPGRALAPPRARDGRPRRAPPRRRRVEAARPDLAPAARAAASSAASGRAVGPGLAHRLVGVGRRQDARRRGDRGAARARAGSPEPSRRSRCCDGDPRRAGASAADWQSIRSVRYGCRRTRSHSPAPSGPRLSQIAFEIAEPAEAVHEAGAAQRVARRRPRSPEPRAGRAGQLGDRPRVPEEVRRLEVDEVRDRRRARRRSARPSARTAQRRLGVDHRVPGRRRRRGRRESTSPRRRCTGSRQSRDRTARRAHSGARSVAAATPPERWATSTYSASCAIRAASGTASPSARPGQPAPVPALVGRRASASCDRRPAARARSPSVRAMAAWWAIMPSTSRWPDERELEPEPEAMQRRMPGAEQPQAGDAPAAGSGGSWSYLSDFSAMSSPNHLACSWASEWQPTLTSSAV